MGESASWRDEPVIVVMPRHWWLIAATCIRTVKRVDGLPSQRSLLPVIEREIGEQSGYEETVR